jgi:predicted neutral ceramidase superfamily lipid hydrolase
MDNPNISSLIRRLEESAKPIAVLIGVSYGIGIMISNGYLASMGIMDFDLLRPKAVLSGLWFLAFLSVLVIAEESIARSLKKRDVPITWRLGNGLIAFCGAFFSYFFVLVFVHAREHVNSGLLRALIIGPLFMFVVAGALVSQVQYAVNEWKRRDADRETGPAAAGFFLSHCMFSVLAVVVFASLFITHFYRFVPQEYGGGRSRSVQIAVSDKAASVLRGMSVVTTENIVGGPVDLVHETSEEIAFRPNGGKTIVLPRREILAIRIM